MPKFLNASESGSWAVEEVVKELKKGFPNEDWHFENSFLATVANTEDNDELMDYKAEVASGGRFLTVHMRKMVNEQDRNDVFWIPLTAVVNMVNEKDSEAVGYTFKYSSLDAQFLGLVKFDHLSSIAPKLFDPDNSFACPKHSACCR